jgi:N-acetylmuramoyl-L-alanine amidase
VNAELSRLLRLATVRTTGPWNTLREPRQGIMLHYDASASDLGAVSWLLFNPACEVSYNWLVLDDGTVVTVAPENARAWHAGHCRPSSSRFTYRDGNSAFYGVAIAATTGEKATGEQVRMVAGIVEGLCRKHGWTAADVLTTHADEAWPRGRKGDTGDVLTVAQVLEAMPA